MYTSNIEALKKALTVRSEALYKTMEETNRLANEVSKLANELRNYISDEEINGLTYWFITHKN